MPGFASTALMISLLLAGCGGPADAPETTVQYTARRAASPAPVPASFPGYQRGYAVARVDGVITVTDLVGNGGSVPLGAGVTLLEFHDARMSFDSAGNPGQAYRIYQAAFNRRSDQAGLGYWIYVMDQGVPAVAVADGFIASPEFRSLYGASPSNHELVLKFYENVLQRQPDPAGLAFWVDLLERKVITRAEALVGFAESGENKDLVAAAIAAGIVYEPVGGRVYAADDSFAGPVLDSCRWLDWGQQAGPGQQSDGLALSTRDDVPVSLAKTVSQFSVRGPFAAEVSVTVDERFALPVPAGAQKYAGMGLYIDAKNYVQLSLAVEGNRRVIKPLVRRAGQFFNLPVTETSASAVRLSIVSDNGTLRFRFQDQRGWRDAGDTPSFPGDEYLVSLNAATIGVQQAFSSVFRQFSVSGNHSYRPYVHGPLERRPDFMIGGVIESYVYAKLFGVDQWAGADPLAILHANGMTWLRTTVTTRSDPVLAATAPSQWSALPWNEGYWQSQEATGALLDMANQHGMESILSFFFSDTAANSGVQAPPAAWRGLTLEQTADKMRAHTQAVAAAYRAQGRRVRIYEVGNEIEYGIAGFRAGERIARPAEGSVLDDLDYMRSQVWTPEATLLKAAIGGIRAVDPDAKIVLHVSSVGLTPGDQFIKAFYRFMVEQGVPFDIAGLSMPYSEGSWRVNEYSSRCWFARLQETTAYIARLGKRTMISEAAYPNSPKAQVAQPMPDFPFSEAGQASWVSEYLRFGNNNPNVVGFMYFYPDWYPGSGGGNGQVQAMEAYGLFDEKRLARPALTSFLLPARRDP